ncbi:DM13 domain-containing protein [Aggregatilinea lenta]|uniref:DM13 domain-containing protein n=1 Tax=Aggregatilinea lenta TaxID=913108 RepID=UPI000E5B90A3|nr:DM13 domain-containing protein [Aggregatilinea lenta]
MNTRPAWGLLTLGAAITLALLLSPLWLDRLAPYLEEEAQQGIFPAAFYDLPEETQDLYNTMYADNKQKAIDYVASRLTEVESLDEPNLPAVDADPANVELLLSGPLVTVDAIHSATGTASIYRLSDGRTLLRLDGLDAIGGPDLHVLLSAYPAPKTRADLDQTAQYEIDLGALKATQGNQNYVIEDPTFNVDNYTEGSVVLYSTRYDDVFSYAPLTSPDSTG